jgi:hypothetical protein
MTRNPTEQGVGAIPGQDQPPQARDGANQKPDLSTLWRDEQRGQFSVELHLSGTVYMTVDADDESAARRKVEAMIEAEEVELYGSDVEDARIRYLRASPTMYLVKRDGKEMGVSRVIPGDEPTAPTTAYMGGKYVAPPSEGLP